MGLADVGKSIAGGIASLAGDLPKAVLFMRKYKQDMLASQEELNKLKQNAIDQAIQNGDYDLGGFFETGQEQFDMQTSGPINSLLQSRMGSAFAADTRKLNAAQDRLEGNSVSGNGSTSFDNYKSIAQENGFCAMEVQYNPSTIYLQSAQGEREINDGSLDNMANTQIRQFRSPPVTNLSFQLVFDAMNQMDAFMLDASMLSAGGVLSEAMNLKKNWADDSEGFTVRTQVEGLIASLFSPLTRRAIFCWAGMVFAGSIIQVTGKYTMFNKIGNPIRATVDVTMQQLLETQATEINSVWYKSYKKVFATGVAGAASKWDQAKNNALLNFSI